MKKLAIGTILIMTCSLLLTSCSSPTSPKKYPIFDYSFKMILDEPTKAQSKLFEADCRLSVTITNKNTYRVKFNDYLKVFLYDKNKNQVTDPKSIHLDAYLDAGKSITPRPTYVESGKLGKKICKSVDSFKYEWD